jgi:excisionase family DNA binding protein
MAKFIYGVLLTRDKEGGWDVTVPDLPGCFTYGESRMEALAQAGDAMRTYVAALLEQGEQPPAPTNIPCPEDSESVYVFFETSAGYVLPGPHVSAAEAARQLGVSPGRITRMIDSGILDGYRVGRHTYVTCESIDRRKEEGARAGRPSKRRVME